MMIRNQLNPANTIVAGALSRQPAQAHSTWVVHLKKYILTQVLTGSRPNRYVTLRLTGQRTGPTALCLSRDLTT